MSSMFGDVLGSVISSVLSNQQGSQGSLGGMLGGVLGSVMNGGRQGGGGGLDGMLGSMLGGNPQSQPTQRGGLGGMLDSMGGLGKLADSGRNAGLLATLLPVAFQLIQNQGGLTGLAAKFQNAGMSDQVNSWVGAGANQVIHGKDVAQAMGSETIAQLAQQLGLPQEQVSNGLAEVLPEILNQMTPQGNVPDNHQQMLDQGIAALTRMLA